MRARWLAAAAAMVLVTACSDSEAPTAPPAPAAAPPAEINLGPAGCPSTLKLRTDLTALFTQPGQILIVNLKYTGIEVALLARKTELARALMYSLTQYILDRYQKGELRGGQSLATQQKVVSVITGLYCLVGLPAPNIPLASLSPDGAVQIVQPSATDTTTVVTGTKFAGVTIPPGAVTTPTLVTITRLPDFPGPLNTLLDQYPAFYQYTSSAADSFSTEVVVGACQVQDFAPPDYSRLVLGHNVDSGIELLRRVPAPFLDCTNLLSMQDPSNSWFRLVSRGWRSLEPVAAQLFLPQKAYASVLGTCCLGGSAKSFSPFGAVDPLTLSSAVSPTSFVGLAGTAVASDLLPSVRVKTPQGRALPGLTVTFALSGGGSIGGAVTTTNADGVATLGSWTLPSSGAASQVTATVTPIPGSTVDGNGLVFTSQLATQPSIAWSSASYRYLLLDGNPAPAGFELPTFADGAWSVGSAPFGSGHDDRYLCPLDDLVRTTWPAAANITAIPPDPYYQPGVSEILLRRTFLVPTGWTGGLTVRVAVDNDMQVFVNGVDVTPSGGAATLYDGFQIHDGCAEQPDRTFTVPASAVLPGGTNVIAVRARDRGKTSYADLEVRLGE
ncbi:MAG TPA: hypothetical protein VG692_03145 [Gemmatimonadales bacterium]|nr:hypothetical protein [Gemmatimonadales bacterium]